MKKFLRAAAAFALAAALTAPSLAAEKTVEGVWQSSTGESRYAVNFCGDGTQICAKLVWLRKDAINENAKYLNTYLVQEARPVASNKWQGEVHAKGQTLSGTITLTSANRIELRGCLLVVFCKSFTLKRYTKT